METAQKAGIWIAYADAVAIISMCIYFNRQIKNLEKEINEMKDSSKKNVEELEKFKRDFSGMVIREIDTRITNKETENEKKQVKLRKKQMKRLDDMEDRIEFLMSKVSSISGNTVETTDMPTESRMESFPPMRRPMDYRSSRRRDDSEKGSDDDSSDVTASVRRVRDRKK